MLRLRLDAKETQRRLADRTTKVLKKIIINHKNKEFYLPKVGRRSSRGQRHVVVSSHSSFQIVPKSRSHFWAKMSHHMRHQSFDGATQTTSYKMHWTNCHLNNQLYTELIAIWELHGGIAHRRVVRNSWWLACIDWFYQWESIFSRTLVAVEPMNRWNWIPRNWTNVCRSYNPL